MSFKSIPGSIKRARDEPGETVLKLRADSKKTDKEVLKQNLEKMDKAAVEERPLMLEYAAHPEDADDSDIGQDDSEDEEEALIRELTRIKQERAEEELKKLAREAAQEATNAISSNPLMTSNLRRRWDDDTVFHSSAAKRPQTEKSFVNDIVRSEFHKKFLNKYVQ